MLRIFESEISIATTEEQEYLLNLCFAASNLSLTEANRYLSHELAPTKWRVYEGGHHMTIFIENDHDKIFVKLLDLKDPGLAIEGIPNYLRAEYLKMVS